MVPIALFLGWSILLVAFVGAGYTLAAAIVARRLVSSEPIESALPLPAITILKPLHGADNELEAALTSLVLQDYPAPVQIVFGMHDPADAALVVVEKIRKRFPDRDISVVVNPRLHGANKKISNLVNMMRLVKHDLLVVADSDIVVPSGYLRAAATDLLQPNVGVVSCLYEGAGTRNLWSRLQAMGINYHFLPNAEFGIVAGLAKPCFGCSIAIRRTMLDQIGGFTAFADCLAEDYEIGRAIRDKGYDISYAPVLVTHD
jgi:ceramide glucosyltransferase